MARCPRYRSTCPWARHRRAAPGGLLLQLLGNGLRTAAAVEVRGGIAGIGGIDLDGRVPEQVRDNVKVRDNLEVSSPRGTFTLQPSDHPIVLLSA